MKTLLAMVVGSMLLAGPALACDGKDGKDKGATAEKSKGGQKGTAEKDKGKTTT
jgi:hypothetical protein